MQVKNDVLTNVTKISILDIVEVLDLPLIGKYRKLFRSIEMIVTSLFLEHCSTPFKTNLIWEGILTFS